MEKAEKKGGTILMKKLIKVQAAVDASLDKAWEYWNDPKHFEGWAFDSDDWEVSQAENDLRVGGMFKIRTRAKDKSESAEFVGTYTVVQDRELIKYDLADGRYVRVQFQETPDGVRVTEVFEPEDETSEEDQRASWQATLQNFRSYVVRN